MTRRRVGSRSSLVARRAWAGLLLAAWVAFGLGLWGFRREQEAWTDAVYHAVSLFKMRFPGEYSNPSVQLEVARFLAPLALWLAAINSVLTLLARQREEFRAARLRGHVVICGLGRRGRRLAELFRGQGYSVVGIERNVTCAGIGACRRSGGLALVGDAADPEVLERAGTMQARCVVAVCGDDETNAEVAAVVTGLQHDGGDVTCLAHLQDDDLRQALNRRVVLGSSPAPPSLEYFSVTDRGARALLRRHPLAEPHGNGHTGLVVVGLGSLGSAFVLRAGRAWRAVADPGPPSRLPLTVVDADVARKCADLFVRYPEVERSCRLEPLHLDPSAAGFAMELDKAASHELPTRIFVCIDDERVALSAGVSLHRRFGVRGVPVTVAVLSLSDSIGRFLADGTESGLEVVGLIEESCTPELLLDSITETLARAIHGVYVEHEVGSALTLREKHNLAGWEQIEERVREDNRAQARHIGAKLAALGYEIETDDGTLPVTELTADEVEELAEMEHQRWVRARLQEGWRTGRRDDAARTHPDLIPWTELPLDRREVDRAFMRALPRILLGAGLRICQQRYGASRVES